MCNKSTNYIILRNLNSILRNFRKKESDIDLNYYSGYLGGTGQFF